MTEATNTAAVVATNVNDAKEVKLAAAVNKATEQLTKATDALNLYVSERAREEAAANIPEGAEVSFKFGRAENRKDYSGKVIAIVETPAGKLLKVLAGEGAELRVYDVPSKQATIVDGNAEAPENACTENPCTTVQGTEGEQPADGGEAGAVDVDALLASV